MDILKMHRPIIIGTRQSNMAMQMANNVAHQLKQLYPQIDMQVKGFKSDGDRFMGDLSTIGGKGAFVRNLDHKLLIGDIDCAVHSLKDIPGDIECDKNLKHLALLEREDPRDCLIMNEGVKDVEPHHVLATSSPRRRAILKMLYPQNKIIPLRGNVNTRLRKMQEGQFDGMVLSYAGLVRLDLQHHVTKIYSTEEFLPAVGQGVVCLKVRSEDVKVCEYLRQLNNTQAETTTNAEREMLWVLKGDCHSAIAGHCIFDGTQLCMTGQVFAPDGKTYIESKMQQNIDEAPEKLGAMVAEDLIQKGAREYLSAFDKLSVTE